MGNPIATRTLQIRHNGKTEQVKVVLGPIEEADGHYRCFYELPILDSAAEAVVNSVCGEDAWQALSLALRRISRMVDSAIDDGGFEVWWLEQSDRGDI